VYITRRGKSPDPAAAGKGVYTPHQMAYNKKLLNKYKRLRYTKTHNLLTGETAATPEEVKVRQKPSVSILVKSQCYWYSST
jgi:hypothetical protein